MQSEGEMGEPHTYKPSVNLIDEEDGLIEISFESEGMSVKFNINVDDVEHLIFRLKTCKQKHDDIWSNLE